MLSCAVQPKRLGPCTPMYSVCYHEFSECLCGILQISNSSWTFHMLNFPLVPATLSGPSATEDESLRACNIIEKIQMDVTEAKDNLLLTKISKYIVLTYTDTLPDW